MKSLKVLISLALTLAIILSVGTVYAATDLGGGFYGSFLDEDIDINVADGALTATQNADEVYNYVDTNNLYSNSSFEESNEAQNTSLDTTEFTKGWTVSSGLTSGVATPSIVNDAHSGNNALKLVSKNKASPRIFSTFADASTSYDFWDGSNNKKSNLNNFMQLENGEYIISFWFKGDIQMRTYSKKYDGEYTEGDVTYENWKNAWGDKFPIDNNMESELPITKWTLYTQKITVTNGKLWSNVYPLFEKENQVVYLDDIQLVTSEQAAINVAAMIENLDITSATAARAIDDINQWVSVLGAQNISNYADFEAKLKQYASIGKYEYVVTNNLYLNSSFENSDTINNTSGITLPDLTDGWTTSYSHKDYIFSLSDNSHSGKNSIYLSVPKGDGNTLLVNKKNIISETDTKGRMDGLKVGETYIVSYWVKGTAATRAWVRAIDASTHKVSTSITGAADNITATDGWKLFAAEFTPNSNGEIYCMVNYQRNADEVTEAYIDDVVMQTKSDAIKSVEKMIENLDVSSPNAARAVDDIEQWIAKLGKDNISNYDLFVMKKSGYVYYDKSSYLENTGFERSDVVTNIKADGNNKELTTGWTTNYGGSNVEFGISKDAHSGNNSLSIDVKAGQNGRLHSSKNYIYTSNVEGDEGYNKSDLDFRTNGFMPNTEYIISYWVKGTGQTHVWGRTVDNEGKNSGDKRGTYIVNPGDTWMLGTNKITTNSNGEFWFNIFANNTTDSNITAIIDDIQVLTVEENIAFVDSLIDQFAKLDNLNANYARAKADIEAWLPVLNNADLNLKYDIVLNEKYNIITPNEGYTNLVQGDYIASVALKGNGEVNRVYGDNITNIKSITTKLSDEYVTHRKRVTVGAYGTHYMGVQLTNSAAINTVDIKDFSLKRVGDVNESGEIDIRDMVRMAKGLNGTDTSVDTLVADYDNSSSFDRDDIAAVRELVLNKDLLS
ncbi:MAG: hypothetical protein U0L84_00720 [Acutalibacteraceae bacterium]|nr:hypothetical protein [Acutalibacteraceae bacterium]